MLFFTYWTTFFSSVLFVYSLLLLTYYFGTTEWYIINFIIRTNSVALSSNFSKSFGFISLLLLIAFFLKTGLTPLHLYKLEVYKGMPFLSIFFYNAFYFLFFFYDSNYNYFLLSQWFILNIFFSQQLYIFFLLLYTWLFFCLI